MKLPTQAEGVNRMDRAAQAREVKAAGCISSSCPSQNLLNALQQVRNAALKPNLSA